MLGIVFTNLVEMVETTFSYELADEILTEADLSTGGAYTSVGLYPFDDIVKIVTALAEKTEIPADTLIYEFGKYLFVKLIEGHQDMMTGKEDLFDILKHLDSNIHV